MSDVKAEKLVKVYTKIRDTVSAKEKAFKDEKKKLQDQMSVVETALAKRLNEVGADSIKTDAGVAFKTTKQYVNIADFDEFLKFMIRSVLTASGFMVNIENWDPHVNRILKHADWQFLNKTVNKSAVLEFMEENDNALPSGVKYESENVVQVRKK